MKTTILTLLFLSSLLPAFGRKPAVLPFVELIPLQKDVKNPAMHKKFNFKNPMQNRGEKPTSVDAPQEKSIETFSLTLLLSLLLLVSIPSGLATYFQSKWVANQFSEWDDWSKENIVVLKKKDHHKDDDTTGGGISKAS